MAEVCYENPQKKDSTLLCEMAVEIIGKSFVTFVYRTFLQDLMENALCRNLL